MQKWHLQGRKHKRHLEPPPPPPQSTKVQPTMSIIVYNGKDLVTSNIRTMVQNASVQEVATYDKDGTLVQIGQEASPAPTTQIQGENEIKEQEKERTKESILTNIG